MSAPEYSIRRGVTEPIAIELNEIDPDTGDLVPVSLAGVTLVRVVMRAEEGDNQIIDVNSVGAQVSISDAANGEIIFVPTATQFTETGPYNGYVRITDSAGAVIDFPSDLTFILNVIAEY